MQIHLPPTITREADHVRFELTTRTERWITHIFAVVMAGMMPLSLLDPRSDLGSTLVMSLIFGSIVFTVWWFLIKSHGVVLRLYPDHLEVKKDGKETGTAAWAEVAQIEDGPATPKGFHSSILLDTEGNPICIIPNSGSIPYLDDVLAAFLPEDLPRRIRQRPTKLEGYPLLILKSIAGCGLAVLMILSALAGIQQSPESASYNPAAVKLYGWLIIPSFFVLGYGLFAIAKIITRANYAAMEEFKVSYPYREGKVLVDLIRVAFGMQMRIPRVYEYSETFRKFENRSLFADYASVGIFLIFLTGVVVAAIWQETHRPGAQNVVGVIVLAVGAWLMITGFIVGVSLAFEKQIQLITARKEDRLEFDGQLKINGVVPDEVFWPKLHPNMADAKTQINLLRAKIIVDGETRTYDLGSMVRVPDEGPA